MTMFRDKPFQKLEFGKDKTKIFELLDPFY